MQSQNKSAVAYKPAVAYKVKLGSYWLQTIPDTGFTDHPILTNLLEEALLLDEEEAQDWAYELGGEVVR